MNVPSASVSNKEFRSESMLTVRRRAQCSVVSRLVPARPARRSVQAKAEGGFDIDKFVAELPVPVEYAYAGVAWGVHLLLTPTSR